MRGARPDTPVVVIVAAVADNGVIGDALAMPQPLAARNVPRWLPLRVAWLALSLAARFVAPPAG